MRGFRISAWVVSGIILFVVVLGGAAMVVGNTDTGRAWIESLTYRITSGTVRLTGLAGHFPTRLTLARLQLIDHGGVWLSADGIALTWSPLRLLDRRIQVDTLQAARLHIERAPVSNGQGGNASVPFIEVDRFSVDTVELGAPLVGTAVTLSAQGNLRLRSLEDADADLSVRRLDGDGEYTLHLRFDPQRMDASLVLHEPASGPLENLLSVPGLGALSATATLNGPRNAEVVNVALSAGDLRATIQGRVDLTHRAADVEYSLTAPALAPRPDVAWARLALQGNFHGSLFAPTATGTLDIEKLRVAGATRIAKLAANLDASGGKLAAHAIVSGLEIPGPQPRFLAAEPLKIDGSLQLDGPSRPLELDVNHPLFALRGHADTVADNDGQRIASIELKLPNLAPFAVFTGQDVLGGAVVNARLAHRPTDDALSTDISLNLSGGKAGWIGVVGPRVAVQAAGDLSADTIKIDSVRMTGRGLSISASGTAKRSAAAAPDAKPAANALARVVSDIQARWEVELSNLAAMSDDVAGTLKISGRVSGPATSLVADADVNSRLSVRGSPAGDVSASVQARGLPSAPSGTLQAHGTLDGAPLNVDAAVDRSGANSYRVRVRQGQWKSAHIEGDMTADAELQQSHGQLTLSVAQLGDFDRLVGTSLSGSAEGRIGFVPLQGHSQAQVQLDVTNLLVGQFGGNVHLQALGVANALQLQLSAELPNLYGYPAKIESTADFNADAHVLRLESTSMAYRSQTLSLLAPAQLSFAKGLSVDDLKIGVQDAVLEVRGQVSPALDLRASVSQVKPALINAFSPGLLSSGLIEMQARLQGVPTSPSGSIQVDASDIRFADDAATGLPPLEVHARAQLANDTAALNAKLSAGGTSAITAAGNVPLDAKGALAIKIGGKLDVGVANPFLEARGMRASGEITADASVTGSTAAPVVGGSITLAQGSLRDYGRGVNLSDISAEVVGREGTLEIKSFKATAISGSLGMTGTLGVLQSGLPLDLKITAKNAQPIASSIVTANLDADVSVKGTLRERLDVTGTLHVNRATIGIPNSLPPDVAVLDVRRRGQDKLATAGKELVIGVELTIDAPREILVQGRGLDAEMGGQIKLSGTTAAMTASGGLDMLRGSFTLVGNKLTFDQGSKVSFDGAGLRKKIDPTLDFTAHTTISETTATLRITGLADAPRFDFSSTPSLPQDQIMAMLLFGETPSQLTALQAAEIGAALATLSGVGGDGPGPLARLQKSLGLDRLSVGANTTNTATGTESAGAAVAAGRYVSKRVYVEAKQSTTGTTQVQVDVDLTKHLKLQTRLGNGSAVTQGTTPENDPGSSVGLSYQFEY